MKSKNTVLFTILISIFLFVFILTSACEKKPVTVRLNFFGDLTEFPLVYSNTVGYFEEEGVILEVKPVEEGEAAAKMISEGELDIGLMSSYAYIRSMMAGHELEIISIYITTYGGFNLLAHSDSGIETPADLNGKRIGAYAQTQHGFHLESLITYYELDSSTIEIVDLEGFDWKKDFAEGKIDAVIAIEPSMSQLLNMEGSKIKKIQLENFSRSNMIFAASQEYIKNNPEAVVRFLSSVQRANLDLQNPTQEIYDQLEEITGLAPAILDRILNFANYELALDQSLLTTLDAQFDWLKRQNYLGYTGSISFLDSIHYDALEEVNPEGITAIRK